jgi:hypothetical protein
MAFRLLANQLCAANFSPTPSIAQKKTTKISPQFLLKNDFEVLWKGLYISASLMFFGGLPDFTK